MSCGPSKRSASCGNASDAAAYVPCGPPPPPPAPFLHTRRGSAGHGFCLMLNTDYLRDSEDQQRQQVNEKRKTCICCPA